MKLDADGNSRISTQLSPAAAPKQCSGSFCEFQLSNSTGLSTYSSTPVFIRHDEVPVCDSSQLLLQCNTSLLPFRHNTPLHSEPESPYYPFDLDVHPAICSVPT